MLERAVITPVVDTAPVRESTLDALVELYTGLNEDDLFYGTWRRRCEYIETNAALSYEQQGMWGRAQQLYEAAQIKARTKAVPFSEGEYMLWEDHWISCAQKLQQWDILYDFAKQENSNDLLLECAWRQPDLWHGAEQRDWLDSIIKGLMDAPTPRRAFFQAFMSLLKFHSKSDALRVSQSQENRAEEEQERKLAQIEFSRLVDEAVQLSIRKWHQLPANVLISHVPMLHHFQELVELHDASVICVGLSQTSQQTLDVKSSELKMLLHSWRDRLPNVWDDINAWQDLVTWRQHIFQLINNTYLAIFPQHPSSNNNNSFAYRGYHETAWLINRFAHVARKHQLPEVCISQLSRIYTLPNIEIQEAFLKLREQAKCHYQTNTDQASGLDVIHNTNLNYFGNQHRAEFYTLKGMFLERMSQKAEANEAFGTALSYDIKLAKAWAAWGQYNDNLFKEKNTEIEYAASAMSCYLEAACLYKNAKSRKMLSRILWLMSLDNASGTIAKAFEDFKGETPVWYWITFIPQLLTSLSHREGRLTKTILVKIAKVFPQALYFLLRTSREDMLAIKKKQEQRQQEQRARTGTDASPPADHAPSMNGQVQTQGTPHHYTQASNEER
jgi:transformation/transcription domain-associated protein